MKSTQINLEEDMEMKYENIRKQVLEAILDAVDQGLIKGTSGNIALRDDEDDVVAITPSGISYKHMKQNCSIDMFKMTVCVSAEILKE